MKCVDELFDYINAFDGNISRADIPYIAEKKDNVKISIGSCCRYIPWMYEKEKIDLNSAAL